MQIFIDDDDGFSDWLERNSNGYALNVARSPRADYLILHRADCRFLRPLDAGHPNMTRDYIKVCAPNIAELQRWADRQFGRRADLQPCTFCKP